MQSLTEAVAIDATLVQRAIDYLACTDLGDGSWAYYAAETRSWWVVDDATLESLGEALADDEPEAYSRWCAETDAEEQPEGWAPGDEV